MARHGSRVGRPRFRGLHHRRITKHLGAQMSPAATNVVTPVAKALLPQRSGLVVNPSVPAGEMPEWKRLAIQKVTSFAKLQPNWDAQGSNAPTWGLRQAAIE